MQRKPTHFMTVNSRGESHLRPLAKNTPPRKASSGLHPSECSCGPCREAHQRARESIEARNAEDERRARIALSFERADWIRNIMDGPRGTSVLHRPE